MPKAGQAAALIVAKNIAENDSPVGRTFLGALTLYTPARPAGPMGRGHRRVFIRTVLLANNGMVPIGPRLTGPPGQRSQ